MNLSFLINLILVIFLVMGTFMVFKGNMNTRSKLVLVVILLILGIYLYNSIPFFRDHNKIIESPQSAKESYTIPEAELKDSNGQFTISTWVYVNDWNYKYGEDKTILEKVVSTGENIPRIYLDEYKNDLKIDMSVMRDSNSNFKNEMYSTLENMGIDMVSINAENLECMDGYIYDASNEVQYEEGAECDISATNETVIIEDIGLQKWVNIIISINTRNMDTYINGKLVKTTAFDNVVNTGLLNNGDINLTPNGGFGGFISNVQYFPYFITPKKAWSIYKDGFGSSFNNLLNKYNMSLTFYEDAVEKNKYWIF
jgi:hypothetical protein